MYKPFICILLIFPTFPQFLKKNRSFSNKKPNFFHVKKNDVERLFNPTTSVVFEGKKVESTRFKPNS